MFTHNGPSTPDTVTVSGTGIVTGALGWTQLESMPPLTGVTKWHIKDGGALVGVASDKDGAGLFAFRGSKTKDFKKYTIGSGWSDKESIPFGYKFKEPLDTTKINKKYPGKGAALCYDNNNTIYATKGNGTKEFWSYSISGNTWKQESFVPVPKALKGGTAMVFYAGKVYLLAGSQKKDATANFFVFDTATRTWSTGAYLDIGANQKPFKDGSCLALLGDKIYALKGGDKTNLFYAYDFTNWVPKEEMPIEDSLYGKYKKKLLVKDGAAAASLGGVIYAVKGGGTNVFWKYTPNAIPPDTGLWTALVNDSVPRLWKKSVIKTGSAMASLGGKIYLLKGNKSPEFWQYIPTTEGIARLNPTTSTITSTMINKLTTTHNFNFDVTPNPFDKLTTIRYTVPISGKVSIKLYNATGRLIETLINDNLNSGTYTMKLSANTLAKGVYFLKYEDNTNKSEVKLIVQ